MIKRLVVGLGVLVATLVGPSAGSAVACYGEPCDAISYACYTVEPILHKVKLDPTCQLG